MSRAVFILAHESPAIRATFTSYLPLWNSLGARLYLLTPADKPLTPVPRSRFARGAEIHTMVCGRSGYSGNIAVQRLKNQVQAVLARAADFNLIFEYDSCIVPTPEALRWLDGAASRPGLHAFRVNWPKSPYPMKFFLHPPWMLDKASLHALARALFDITPDYYADGYADQIMALASYRAGIPQHNTDCNFGGPAFTRNVIFGSDVPEILSLLARGVFIFHGGKTNANELLLNLFANGPRLH